MPTLETQTVDTDGTQSPDYTSISSWESQNRNLVTEDVLLTVEVKATTGVADSEVYVIGWTTDSTRYIIIDQVQDPLGIWNSSYYRISAVNTTVLNIGDGYTRVRKVQIELQTNGSNCTGFKWNSSQDVTADRMIAKGKAGGSNGTMRAFWVAAGGTGVGHVAVNCLALDMEEGGGSDAGFYGYLTNACKWYYCVAYNCKDGFWGNGYDDKRNCIGANNSDEDYRAGPTSDPNNLSTDGTGYTGLQNKDPKFVDAANDDFHIQSDSDAIGVGAHLAGYTTDVDGDTRDASTPDVGYDEYVDTDNIRPLLYQKRSCIVN